MLCEICINWAREFASLDEHHPQCPNHPNNSSPCQHCQGKGGEMDQTWLGRGWLECAECDGTGRIPPTPEELR